MDLDIRAVERLLTEDRLPLTQLAREQSVSIPTVWRWVMTGIDGHVLATFRLGGRKRYTTRQAFSRWVAAINVGRRDRDEPSPKRDREIAAAESRLDQLGI